MNMLYTSMACNYVPFESYMHLEQVVTQKLILDPSKLVSSAEAPKRLAP